MDSTLNLGCRVCGLLVFLLSTDLFLGSGAQGAAAPQGQPVTIRVGHVSSTATFPLNLGIRSGIFKRRGLNVIAKQYADFSALYLGHRAGDIEIGASGGVGSIVELHARGVPVKVIWGSSKMNNDILVRVDSSVKDLGQLKGKRIGILGGAASFSANMFMAVLQAYYSFDPRKDGNVQFGASALLASLLQNGDLEAFLSNDPVTSIELAKGRVKSIGEMGAIYASHGGRHPTVGAISVSDQFAAEHPDAVSAFLGGWVEAVKILKTDRKVWEEMVRTDLDMKDDKVVTLLSERIPGLWPVKWDEADAKGEMEVLKFISRYAGSGFLEKIPESAFSSRFQPK